MASTNVSLLTSHIFKSRQVVLELMDKQGYDVTGYANFSISEVNSMKQNNQLDMLLESKPDSLNKRKIYIRYYLAKTLRPSNIQEMIDDLEILKISHPIRSNGKFEIEYRRVTVRVFKPATFNQSLP